MGYCINCDDWATGMFCSPTCREQYETIPLEKEVDVERLLDSQETKELMEIFRTTKDEFTRQLAETVLYEKFGVRSVFIDGRPYQLKAKKFDTTDFTETPSQEKEHED